MLTFSKNTTGTPSLWKSILLYAVFRLLVLMLLFGVVSSLRAQSITVTASRGEIVAATLILEAGGEADSRGMAAVREVIANRAKNKTELAVCLAPKQFSCWNKITVERGIEIAKRHPKWSHALALVNQKTNYTNGATHYHAQKVSPYWAKKLAKTVQIGNHIFYK